MAGGPSASTSGVASEPSLASAVSAPAAGGPVGRQFIDILVVDDMENVHKKLRTLLPEQLSMNGCVSARDALQHCQERIYRVVLVDSVIPDVNSVALMNQLRVIQPHAVMTALALRTANDIGAEFRGAGLPRRDAQAVRRGCVSPVKAESKC